LPLSRLPIAAILFWHRRKANSHPFRPLKGETKAEYK
jgi:hypothetical protein